MIDSSESHLTQTLKTDDKVDERQSTPNALKIKMQLSINASRANDPLMSSESRHKNKSKSFALNKRPLGHLNSQRFKKGESNFHNIS